MDAGAGPLDRLSAAATESWMTDRTQAPDGWRVARLGPDVRVGNSVESMVLLSELMTFGVKSNPSQLCCPAARTMG